MRPRIRFGIYFLAALSILLLPLDWLLGCILSICWHEMCHQITIFMFTGKWQPVSFELERATINLPDLTAGKELICAISGPFGGLLMVMLYPWFPKLAFCAFVQSVYNLLPIYPLDGGRAIRCLIGLIFSDTYADYICQFLSALCAGILLTLGFCCTVMLGYGPVPLVVGLTILVKSRKFPCKERYLEVQ